MADVSTVGGSLSAGLDKIHDSWGWFVVLGIAVEEKEARADRKAKLQAQIAHLSQRVDAKVARAKARSRQAAEEFQAKVTALQQWVNKERGDRKAALEARLTKLRSDYQGRDSA
jgi:predicted RNA-binding protein with RPS1 domain